jgi:hypothetical protein
MTPEKLRWIALLCSTITWGLVGTTGANLVAGPKRAHNRIKLINECLARHQLSYTTFYFALFIAIKDLPDPVGFAISTLSGVAILCFLAGLAMTKDQGAKLQSLGHTCADAAQCGSELHKEVKWRFLRGNLILAFLSLFFVVLVIFFATPPVQSQGKKTDFAQQSQEAPNLPKK